MSSHSACKARGDADAGLYGAVNRILDRVIYMPTAVMTPFFPIVAASWPRDPGRTVDLQEVRTVLRGIDG